MMVYVRIYAYHAYLLQDDSPSDRYGDDHEERPHRSERRCVGAIRRGVAFGRRDDRYEHIHRREELMTVALNH